MKKVDRPAIALAVLWASLALNVAIVLLDLAVGNYALAVLLAGFCVLQTAWLAIAPKVNQWNEACVHEAQERQRIASLTRGFMEEQIRTGAAEVRFSGEVAPRRH